MREKERKIEKKREREGEKERKKSEENRKESVWDEGGSFVTVTSITHF